MARLAPALPPVLLAAFAFLLAAQPVNDADVWWHLRAGEWILEHRSVPDLDPFTFGSETERWVDLHWGFQIPLALSYRAGGMAGVVVFTGLLAAGAGAAGWFAVAGRFSPTTALVAWVPGLVLMSTRFRPRPEMLTLLFLALFLVVLARAAARPRLLWALPALQVLWVNTHGLFVLGPVVFALWAADQFARRVWLFREAGPSPAERKAWWRAVGVAGALLVAACFANPYGMRGATFPLVLYPKVTQAGNPYKEAISEFESPSRMAAYQPPVGPPAWYLVCLRFALVALPLAVVLPAVWPADRPGPPPDRVGWGVVGAVLALAGLHAAAPVLALHVPWLGVLAAELPPPLLLATGVGLAVHLRTDRWAAVAALAGVVGLAAWAFWLNDYWSTGREASPGVGSPYLPAAGAAGVVVAVLYARAGGSLFALGLAAAFTYLALQATNSLGRFGLVAGAVAVMNLGPWALRWVSEPAPRAGARVWVGARVGFAAALAGWVAVLATGRVTEWVGPMPPATFREEPFLFAHDACRFAGQDGMPGRALVFDMQHAGLYEFHNGPARKPFMDPRLEVPTLQTFRTYVGLQTALATGRPGWEAEVGRMGQVTLLISTNLGDAQSAVFRHPGWRLVYFDELAAVFLPANLPGREAWYPTVDPAAEHFTGPPAEATSRARQRALALIRLGDGLKGAPEKDWTARIPILLAALGSANPSLRNGTASPRVWQRCGVADLGLLADPRSPPPPPGAGWEPVTGVRWARATYRLATAASAAGDEDSTAALYTALESRAIPDATARVGAGMHAFRTVHPAKLAEIEKHVRANPPQDLSQLPPQPPAALVARALATGWYDTATQIAERAGATAWEWAVADPLAGAYMHLGRPDQARAVWASAAGPPSEAIRTARVASTYWVEGDLDSAAEEYRRAAVADPKLAEAEWGLAWVEAERGRVRDGIEACRRGLAADPPEKVRTELQNLRAMLERYAK